MPDPSPTVLFEVIALDPERAMHFYAELLGWTFRATPESSDCWEIVLPGAPALLGVLRRERRIVVAPPRFRGLAPLHVFSFIVTGLSDILARVAAGGGAVITSLAVPQLGERAMVRNTEGNVFTLLERPTRH